MCAMFFNEIIIIIIIFFFFFAEHNRISYIPQLRK